MAAAPRWCAVALALTGLFVGLANTQDTQKTVEIAPGVNMPVVLLGTGYARPRVANCSAACGRAWQEKTVQPVVEAWLKTGARGIDTALIYNTQEGIAKAIAASGVPRSEIFILTKIPGVMDYNTAMQTLDFDRQALAVGSGEPAPLDAVIIHWCRGPTCTAQNITETWRALEDYFKAGKARAIGISNFCEEQLNTLLASATIKPHIHQFERSPYYKQGKITNFTLSHGIHVQEYAPLNDADRQSRTGPPAEAMLHDPVLESIAAKHNVSTAQVALQWAVQAGYTATPRVAGLGHETPNLVHLQQNHDVLFGKVPQLSAADITAIDAIPDRAKTWNVGVCS